MISLSFIAIKVVVVLRSWVKDLDGIGLFSSLIVNLIINDYVP